MDKVIVVGREGVAYVALLVCEDADTYTLTSASWAWEREDDRPEWVEYKDEATVTVA